MPAPPAVLTIMKCVGLAGFRILGSPERRGLERFRQVTGEDFRFGYLLRDGNRTRYLQLRMLSLYQMSYTTR